jgi:hypothetical protein
MFVLLKVMLMTISFTFADTNEAINHAFKEEAITYKYVADDFKEGKATHSLASKVFGNHHFKGPRPRNNFGETSRTCSLSIKGGFFENLKFDDQQIIGVQKRLDSDMFMDLFPDLEESIYSNYEAFEIGESYSGLRCDRSMLWVQNLLLRMLPPRAAKVSQVFDQYKEMFKLDPRKTYKEYNRTKEIYFFYPEQELSAEEMSFYKKTEANHVYQRVLGRQADDYELTEIDESDYSQTWVEELQNRLVEKRSKVREEAVIEAVQSMTNEANDLYSDSEDYWLETCLGAIKVYDKLKQQCNKSDGIRSRIFNELSNYSVADDIEALVKPNCSDLLMVHLHNPSNGEKCYRMIETGKLGHGVKKALRKLDERYRTLVNSEKKLKEDLTTEFDKLVKLVRPQTVLAEDLASISQELEKTIPNSKYLHQLFLKSGGPDFSHIRLYDYEHINPIIPIVNPLDPDLPTLPEIPKPEPGCGPIWNPDLFSIIK